jgi:hypothetical protein
VGDPDFEDIIDPVIEQDDNNVVTIEIEPIVDVEQSSRIFWKKSNDFSLVSRQGRHYN